MSTKGSLSFMSFLLAVLTALVLIVWVAWYGGVVGARNPSPPDIQARCSHHQGVAQLVPRPWPEQNLRVVCRDGSVFDTK